MCRNGRCRCPAGLRRCGQNCIPFTECCRGCPTGEICVDGTCGSPACGRQGPCRVFVTSQAFTGILGGVGGADAKCQQLADVSPLTRGGKYRAWISGGSANSGPASRFTNLDRTGPYVLTNGAEIAADWSDLVDGSAIGAPIHHTEWGDTTSPAFFAWTYTLGDGHPGTVGGLLRFCNEWASPDISEQGGNGDTRETGFRWTQQGTDSCAGQHPLYCLEQG
jgi:hypothetical protein